MTTIYDLNVGQYIGSTIRRKSTGQKGVISRYSLVFKDYIYASVLWIDGTVDKDISIYKDTEVLSIGGQ